MKNLTLVTFFLVGFIAVVLSTEVASFISSVQNSFSESPSTSSSSGSTAARMTRENHDDDDDKEKKNNPNKSAKDDDDEKSGGSKALRLMRQNRNPSSSASTKKSRNDKDEETTSATTRRTRRVRAATNTKNNQVVRQAGPQEPDSNQGAPGAPDEPLATDTVAFPQPIGAQQSTGRQALPSFPVPAPRPNRPPQQGGDASSLTLPDGVELIVGQIKSGFTCASKIYGYYADIFNDCKLFHVCVPVGDGNGVTNPIQWSFVCGNQTLFNQEKLTCDYQENVDCSKSESFYSINENFGRPEDKIGAHVPRPVAAAPPPTPTRG